MNSEKPTWLVRLKKRWGIESNLQVAIILVVFAITGSSSVYVKRPIYDWLGITPEAPWWLNIILFIVILLPVYQVLLLFWGTLFGQFRFFWDFEKKMFGRIGTLFGGGKSPD